MNLGNALVTLVQSVKKSGRLSDVRRFGKRALLSNPQRPFSVNTAPLFRCAEKSQRAFLELFTRGVLVCDYSSTSIEIPALPRSLLHHVSHCPVSNPTLGVGQAGRAGFARTLFQPIHFANSGQLPQLLYIRAAETLQKQVRMRYLMTKVDCHQQVSENNVAAVTPH